MVKISIHTKTMPDMETETEVTRWHKGENVRGSREEYVSVSMDFGAEGITVFMTPEQYLRWKVQMREALCVREEVQQRT